MELFGYLTFVGELQSIPTQNAASSNEPFIVREIIVHTFVPGSQNGEVVPFLRGVPLRLSGRQAQAFNIAKGHLVAVEYGTSCKTYTDTRDNQRRVVGNNNVLRICQLLDSDIDQVSRIMQAYEAPLP